MQQKTIFRIFLIIGINTMLLSTGCKKEPNEPLIQTATYSYKNELRESVKFEIHNLNAESYISYTVNNGDSIVFTEKMEGLARPFAGSVSGGAQGDSVIIKFADGKCISYKVDYSTGTFGGTGVFDLSKYENYSQELISQRTYSLDYIIDSTDYKLSILCK